MSIKSRNTKDFRSLYSFRILIPIFSIIFLIGGCKKDWLDAKSNIQLVVPSAIADMQGMLDYTGVFNVNHPSLGEIGADNYYLLPANWSGLVPKQKNGYVWADDVYAGTAVIDWDKSYERVFYANNALDGIDKITPQPSEQAAWNNVKGTGLFLRSLEFYNLSQLFAPPYDASTATQDLGIPLRTTADINIPSQRASVKDTYERIIDDLLQAKDLLPTTQPFKTRPTKATTFALLARTYLSMRQYDKALQYADSSLKQYNTLLDYNQVNGAASFPFPQTNVEVLFLNGFPNETIFGTSRPYNVDTTLYASYLNGDLRKTLFFQVSGALVKFRGAYRGSALLSGCIAVDEMYLTRAEGYARAGNTTAAMQDLNTLMQKRWNKASWIPFTAVDANDALQKILTERRKELCFRGIRWVDLRRLNKEGAQITITRNINGQVYTLPPNSVRYVWPIPIQEIQASGIAQNPR